MPEAPPAADDQRIILRIFAGLRAAPGQMIPLTTVFLNWPPSLPNARFAQAVESLAAQGTIRPNPPATAYALVDDPAVPAPDLTQV